MGELHCMRAREEVRRGQTEGTKRRDDRGVRKRVDIKEKVMLDYILSLYFIICSKHKGGGLTKNCKAIECLDVDWVYLAEDRDHWRVLNLLETELFFTFQHTLYIKCE